MKRLSALLPLLIGGCVLTDPGDTTVEVVVPAGATWQAAVDSLVRGGVITSPRWFSLIARARGAPSQLKSGVYEFRAPERYTTVLRALRTGRGREARLVIREGLMLAEIAAEVQAVLGIPADSFKSAVTDPTLIAAFEPATPSLAGYLYPETYVVAYGLSARPLVTVMLREFTRHWDPAWDERRADLGLSRHEVVTLASIIEGEARHEHDRAFVSGVYHNRLRRGMRLQADPTVIYALGVRRRLWERDYLIDHPYNTYRIDGLPPAPIGNPRRASIEAALFPADVPYLFFVAGPDGKHIFSNTLREHEQARRQVRVMRTPPDRSPLGAPARLTQGPGHP